MAYILRTKDQVMVISRRLDTINDELQDIDRDISTLERLMKEEQS